MIIVIVQSRLSSTRLPKKALLPLYGKPILGRVLQSMKRVIADKYLLACDYDSFSAFEHIANENGFDCFAGPKDDVLERFCMLLEKIGIHSHAQNPDIVVRATGDNPFLFYEAAQESVVQFTSYIQKKVPIDYFTFTGLPHGSGVEVFSAQALLQARMQTSIAYDHEHVCPALYNHTDYFKSIFLPAPPKWNYYNLRTTVDTAVDYENAQRLAFFCTDSGNEKVFPFSSADIISACMKNKRRILCFPSVKKGRGTGHLRRCVSLALNIGADIFIGQDASLENWKDCTNSVPYFQLVYDLSDIAKYDLFVADIFMLEADFLRNIQTRAPHIPFAAIDEGSSLYERCDYLLDIIPTQMHKRKANMSQAHIIPLPKKRRKDTPVHIQKVLISIGGEDPSHIGLRLAQCFSSLGYDVTFPSVPIVNLKETLYIYDLVVTHYGFTAFEASSAGCAVLLAGTSNLHVRLSKKLGYTVILKNKITVRQVKKIMRQPVEKLIPQNEFSFAHTEDTSEISLADTVLHIAGGQKLSCPLKHPLTESNADKVVVRYADRTVRVCSTCGVLYLSWKNEKQKEYGTSYFFDEYKNQYGKTYLEDFDAIFTQGLRRSKIIAGILQKTGYAMKDKTLLLDIGCAYGHFMCAAARQGFSVFGTDIAQDAITYVKDTLFFPAAVSLFPQFDSKMLFAVEQFDVITLWYVIEHFNDLHAVLLKISGLLKKGGVLAFSTPSASGVSRKFSSYSFFKNSPIDHITLWEPKKCAQILSPYGLEVVRILSTGHHPERFPLVKKMPFLLPILKRVSVIFNLGDTFEVYLKKR